MKIDANLPCLVTVDDYHHFRDAQEHMQLLNRQIRVYELGFAALHGKYIGIAYMGRRPDKATIKALMAAKKIEPGEADWLIR